MNHDAVRRSLSDYLDESLPERRRARVEGHLAACPACRDELAALRRTVALLRDLGEPEAPPPDLAARVFARIDAGEAEAARRWGLGLGGLRWLAPALTGAAALALVLVVQGVEIEVKLPGAGPALEAAPAASAQFASRASAPPVAATPVSTSAGASTAPRAPAPLATETLPLRLRCARDPASASCRAWQMWLVRLAVDDPSAFLAELDAVPGGARERWLDELSRFAAHSGTSARVAERLRQADDPRASRLAPRFERIAVRVD